MTQPAIATKWTTAAAITSAWKTSWKPKMRGHGFGRRGRVDDGADRVEQAADGEQHERGDAELARPAAASR